LNLILRVNKKKFFSFHFVNSEIWILLNVSNSEYLNFHADVEQYSNINAARYKQKCFPVIVNYILVEVQPYAIADSYYLVLINLNELPSGELLRNCNPFYCIGNTGRTSIEIVLPTSKIGREKFIHSLMHSKLIQLLLLCTFSLFSDVVFGDPPYTICSSSGSYVNGSSFENNLNNLLSSLSSNASDSKFYNTSYGIAPDTVYGLYMCLDYISNDSCQKCIATVTEEIVKLCPQAEEAIVWEELCQLRYSNNNFLGSLNVTGNIGLDNVQNLTDSEKFESAVNETLRNLTKVASFKVSANMYATGDVPFEDETIFALVQCTRDLTANDCNRCLQSAIGDIPSCCYASIGGRVLSRSCYLRYEFYAFYNGATGPTDSSNGNRESKSKQFKSLYSFNRWS